MQALRSLGVFFTMVSLAICTDWQTAKADILLEAQGSLTSGDAVFEDGSLYDQHRFNGSKGQQITVFLESQEFDPYLILLNPERRSIRENDDIGRSNRNSQLRVVLPSTGTFIVVVNSYESGKSGQYTIRIDREGYQSSTDEAIVAAIPNSTPLCHNAMRNGIERLGADQEIGIVVSALQLRTLYKEVLDTRPYGLNLAFSGPATASLLSSPHVLESATSELIRNCDTLGAVVFGSSEANEEKIFGYLPTLAETQQAGNDVPVGAFTCIAPPDNPVSSAADNQRVMMPTPEWGEQICP